MIIRICFPYYKDRSAYERILKEARKYKGPYELILKYAQGTIVHDVRNVLVANALKIKKHNPKLPEFDVLVMVDNDVVCTLDDIIYLAESEKDIIFLPYELRGNPDAYNAGFLNNKGFIHLPIFENGLKKVDGGGNGCKAWKRKVFETIPPYWFWPDTMEIGEYIDSLVEDWAFDAKCRKAGFDVWCDFNRPVKHNTKEPETMSNEKNADLSRQGRKLLGTVSNISASINNLIDAVEICEAKIAELTKANEALTKELKELKEEKK
jgi:hypothetical protein